MINEKLLRKREKLVIESEMRSEKDKQNGISVQLTDGTRYSVKYYKLQKSY